MLPINRAFLTPTTAIEFSTLVLLLARPNKKREAKPSGILEIKCKKSLLLIFIFVTFKMYGIDWSLIKI